MRHNNVTDNVGRGDERIMRDSLWDGFTVSKTGCDGTSGLSNVVGFIWDLFRFDSTIVFVPPHDQVNGVVKHSFRDGILGSMLHPANMAVGN